MASTYASGSKAMSGYYFNAARWHVEPIANDGDRLPEGRGSWVKVPAAAALLLVPVLGATFLVFLPLIGFVLLVHAAMRPLVEAFPIQATELAATVSPGWQPGEAHFTGKRPAPAGVEGDPPAPCGDGLDALAAEIDRRRRRA